MPISHFHYAIGAAARPLFTQDFPSDRIDGAPARHMSHGTQELHPISIALVISLEVIPIVRHASVPTSLRQLCESSRLRHGSHRPRRLPPPSCRVSAVPRNRRIHQPPRPLPGRPPSVARIHSLRRCLRRFPASQRQFCEPPPSTTVSLVPPSHRLLCESSATAPSLVRGESQIAAASGSPV